MKSIAKTLVVLAALLLPVEAIIVAWVTEPIEGPWEITFWVFGLLIGAAAWSLTLLWVSLHPEFSVRSER